ncbi:MAG: calcium/sodium antiporter [Fimbriimonadales bacterium]|nr:calcium/sodium antiporter [Fimbriimonadales bacterium]
MSPWLWLLIGFVSAGLGGELFVRGAVGLASWARVSPGIIGATVAAFATSSAEAAVAISSATAGKPEISLGNAIGANVANIAFILGAGLLISAMTTSKSGLKRDFPAAILAPIVLILFAWDGQLSRLDCALMLVLFFAWLTGVTMEAKKQRSEVVETLGEINHPLVITWLVIGLGLLAVAGHTIVIGAEGVGEIFGLDKFVVGATLVAVGTTIPELATMVIAKLKKHDEVGLGTVIGSNIFNILFVVPVAGVIHPISASIRDIGVGVAFGVFVLLCAYPQGTGKIPRWRGVVLVTLYVAYLTVVLRLGPN